MCDNKQRRNKNYTETEKQELLRLVQKYGDIINNKKTDGTTVSQKKLAWEKVANEYNASASTGERSAEQVRMLHNNFKRMQTKGLAHEHKAEYLEAKKQKADDNKEQKKTGGGSYSSQLTDHGARVLVTMVPIPVQPINNDFDDYFGEGAYSLQVRCLENGRFYRDPDRSDHKHTKEQDCSKYFLCLEGEVFEFRCSSGLYFDVNRQICDSKYNVRDCNTTSETIYPIYTHASSQCHEVTQQQCKDGTCLPQNYFCDGSIDCLDGSDEKYCNSINDLNAATPCNTTTCHLPNCFCSDDGTFVPGRLDPAEVPQMIILTFDDAINFNNWDLYSKKLFTPNRRNPNGCPIKGTFFVSHPQNNYHLTQRLWNDGHEIAVHSVTHRGPEGWWSHNATIEEWFDEMIGQANIINKFAKVRMEDINGLRVPFLRVGWNKQFLMMKEFGFSYDSSIVAPFSDPPLWPYTLDHKIPHECLGGAQNCPTRSYPGIWEMVLNQLIADKYTCAMVDSCPTTFSSEDTYRLLMYNFKRHYFSNRAPFGLYFHSTWFKNKEYLSAFQKFIEEMLQYPNVWFVTNWEAIQWLKQPTPIRSLKDFEPWDCDKYLDSSEEVCASPNICKLYNQYLQQELNFYTCTTCPQMYPEFRNEFGRN